MPQDMKDREKPFLGQMRRICGNCVFCLIGTDRERLCSLASNEYITEDEDGGWIAGRLVDPEDECIYPPSEDYVSFTPVEAGINWAQVYPRWCRNPDSRVLLEAQEAQKGGQNAVTQAVDL